MVMRPKSRATVVVFLRSTPSRMSTCMPGWLRGSSVRSGRISVTDPTRVVLPAPNPPATRSLMVTGTSGWPSARLKPAEAIGHLPEDLRVGQLTGRGWLVHHDERARPQVGEQHLDHAQRQVEVCREIGHRSGQAAHGEQGEMLGVQAVAVDLDPAHGGHQGDEIEKLASWPGPAAGEGVGADDRARLLVKPMIFGRRHAGSFAQAVGHPGPWVHMEVRPDT